MKINPIKGYLVVCDDDSYAFCKRNSRYGIIQKLVKFEDDVDAYQMCRDFYGYSETGKLAILKVLADRYPIIKTEAAVDYY